MSVSEISLYDFKKTLNSKSLLISNKQERYIIRSSHKMPYSQPDENLINIQVPLDKVNDLKLHDYFRNEYETFPLFIASIPNAVIYSPLMIGFVDGDLITETIPPWRRDNLYFYKSLAKFKDCKSIVDIDSPVCLLANYSHTNYWHWVTQCLVNIYLLKYLGLYSAVKFLVPESSRKYIQETLDLLGIESDKVVKTGLEQVRVKKLIYPSFLEEHSNGRFSPLILEVFAGLSDACNKKYQDKINVDNRLLYLSRRDTNARRIINEDALIIALEKEGFKEITCTDYTVKEQISIVKSANVVVSPHGAAMTNIGFMSSLGKVFEINPNRWGVSCFYSLTRMKNQQHYLFVEKNISNPDKGHQMTMEVDIKQILYSLSGFISI